MPTRSNIKYLSHRNIDKSKWDKCIDEADNGLIYGYSFYLDHMAKHWDGLVLDDYEAVMPLTWNRKFWISYLYQPAFTANLGIFGKQITETLTREFLNTVPKKFKLIEISLNTENTFEAQTGFSILRANYDLHLNRKYNELYKNYRENHQRNIQKALQAGCMVKKNIPVKEVIALNRQQLKNIASLTSNDYERFKELYHFLSQQNKSTTYGIVDSQNRLIAGCVFFFSHSRAYYILAGNHPDSRTKGASHTLIDAFIKDHAENELVLDFEGSDIESLALFYRGFGATKKVYPAIRWSGLPWWVRWFKNSSRV